MLNEIKAMLKEKQQFLEAAQMIVEDTMDFDLDDSIVLGESKECEDDIEKENCEITEECNNDKKTITESSEDEVPPVNNEGDILDEPVEPEVSEDPEDPEDPTPTLDDLPTPVGKQTGLPITGDIEDVLDSTVDLKSNTIKDILPVPPANAAEALPNDDNDIVSQKVDSGFEGSNEENELPTEPESTEIPNEEPHIEPTEPEENTETEVKPEETEISNDEENKDQFTEAININGGDTNEEPPAEPTTDDTPADETSSNTEEPAPDVAPDDTTENPVTSAVIDKVNEVNTEETPTQSSDMTKEEVLKKLSSLTKNIEDAKKLVIDSLNK